MKTFVQSPEQKYLSQNQFYNTDLQKAYNLAQKNYLNSKMSQKSRKSLGEANHKSESKFAPYVHPGTVASKD